MSEFDLYGPIQIAASRAGARLFRNHVGIAWQMASGAPKGWKPPAFMRPVKIGLGTGSGDFVGWAPVTITPDMVGKTLAVFSSIEVKPADWKETPKWINGDQGNWVRVVQGCGGIAGVAQSPEQAAALLARLNPNV